MVQQIVYKLQRFFFEGLSTLKCEQEVEIGWRSYKLANLSFIH